MASSFKSPADTAKACVGVAALKEKAPLSNLIVLSFLAGAYIAFGGLLAEVATGGMAAAGWPTGLVKLVFGGVFPVGLMLVVIAGSELFTGNCMYMPMGILQGEASVMGTIKNWVGSWVFNLVGALFVAYVLAYLTGILTAEPWAATAVTIAKTKALGGAQFIAAGKTVTSLSWMQVFWRAIGCNWLVCLAVYLAVASDDVIGKIFGIWFPIMAFVCIGFEHVVANMFFIPVGIFIGGVTWSQFFINNMIPATLGNIVGGAIFVGCIYWFTYLRGTNKAKA
ncbi:MULTISPECIES: formate/nitrite transporter family protein [Methanobacterium]|jgi:formate/nitrite transporter|uniref:Probable formate transporter n=1 Tax=Methanobacterium formicicum TaxID=2162 RepID=A0A089ZG19_METFO|nr:MULTISPECIES: formate/nitrite transporter family protein [Methanobacterium]AIS30998.1 formate/nitrite transporter FdhC [Methanobacterium formicicum]MDG3546904.1 formate/nitrite transporter family protein [Methanobacterium formicicum]CEA13820.1 putative formate transporter [Methanobacterium formicicum]CEL23790.1 putative formate transporter [Methanobacterium formicicum]